MLPMQKCQKMQFTEWPIEAGSKSMSIPIDPRIKIANFIEEINTFTAWYQKLTQSHWHGHFEWQLSAWFEQPGFIPPPQLHPRSTSSHIYGLAGSLAESGATKMVTLSFTAAPQKPVGDVMETTSTFYTVYVTLSTVLPQKLISKNILVNSDGIWCPLAGLPRELLCMKLSIMYKV